MYQPVRMGNKSRNCCSKCLLGTFLYLFVLFFLLFIIVFVIIPIVFKYSIGIQKGIVFPTWAVSPKNYSSFSDFEEFGIKGVKNLYVNLEEPNNVTLGVWQILPSEILSDLLENDDYNYDGILTNKNYSILLYMHGNGGDRTTAVGLYEVLRKTFHIFAVDYRGYGDSSKAEMTETGIVGDIVNLYKWLKDRSPSSIYIWGHSLGTGVATHVISNLNNENIRTTGLILEGPFTSVTDVMRTHPILQVYSYLPWFEATVIDPMIDNDLNFDSKKYILNVDCPIMILHAKDDDIIPYNFATELYNIALSNRNTTYQGNVTYHLFESMGYGHMFLYKAPELPRLVGDFGKECEQFNQRNIKDTKQ